MVNVPAFELDVERLLEERKNDAPEIVHGYSVLQTAVLLELERRKNVKLIDRSEK